MDFLTRETPDGQTPFLNKITATMPKEEAERFEIALLDNILKHSRYLVVSGDKKVLDIVNSGEFLRRAGEIKGQFGAKAKDYIDLVSAWHKNFKNDAVLAHLTRNPASEPKVSTGLNPSLDARLKYVATATMFDGFFRLVPRIPFITDKFIGNDKIQAAALRYYLKKTLNESPSISALRRKLNFDLDKGNLPLNSQTRERLRQITNEVQQSEAQMDELAENLIKSSDENANLIQNLENSAQFGRDMFILGEENLNGDIVKWALQNNKRIAVNKLNTQKAQELGFKHPDDVRRTIGADEIRHTLSRHGENSELVKKSGQPPVNENDIANYQKISDNADETLKSLDNSGNLVEVSFKQVNGYFVVVEQVRNKNNEFSFKTMFKGNGTYKNSEAYTKTAEKAQTLSQGYEPSANSFAQSADEIIPNSNSQSQAPQKSLLEQARENTERLRAAQEAEQIAQKEAELARLKEMQAKNAEILAQKEAAAGQAINEAQSLQIGTPIKAQKISDTKIIINDNTAPFKAEFIIAKKDDIKPNFERTGTQGRSERQDKVIESIQSDFKPHLIFEQMGGFEGLPIILKDGQVIAGNHRAQAIKGLTGEQLARYKQAAKEKFGVDLKDDEVIVRLVKDGDEKELINLAFMSNVGRESNLGEKALANLAKYDSQIQALPNRINADSVFELESQVAKALDTQGNGLNVFDTNLALFSRLAKNSSNTDILESLNTLKSLSQDEKEKVLRMFVSNAGEFHNLAKDTQLKSLNLNDYLADALIVAAKNVDSTTRAANYAKLLDDIITMQASAKEMLKIDPFLFENFKSKALGYALARFARLENPSAKLFEFLKASKADLENLYTGNIFESNKAISDIDIYDFLKHAINSGEDLIDKQGRNIKGEITSRLDDLRKVENALIDSGEIQFAKSKAKPQGREAKETNINSLFADDELQMQATKPAKELNLSDEKDFNELSEFFALNSKDKEFNEIFAKATKAAQKLGVKVKFDESAARSHFVLNDNTITIAAANKEHFQAQDLLHELIHATTRKALKDFNENPTKAAQSYTKRQIEAIKEIISLYQKSKGIAKRQGKDAYALQNVDEFVAELSSGEFRAFLKAQDIFERFIKALIRFFTGDSERLAKNVNSYKALKESYYKILDDYEPQVVEKSQSQLEFEMAQRQIGELKAQKAELLSQMRPPVTQAVRDEIKEKAKKLNKEIERTFLKAKLTQKIGKENLTSQRLEQARKNNERIIVDKLDSQEAQKLGFDEPEFVAQSIDGDAINHTLNRHGEGSELVRNGQPAVTLDDIAKYPQITKIADETLLDKTKEGLPAKVSFKQINGYYVVVEEVHKGQNELSFKTMYKGKGDYKNSEAYTTTLKNSKGVGASPLSSDLKSAEFYLADKEIIPNSKGQSQVSNNDEPKYCMDFYYGARKKDFLQVNELMNDYLNAPDTATAAQVAEKLKQKQSELLNEAEKIKKEYFTKKGETNYDETAHFKAEFLSKNKRQKLEGQRAWNEYASNKIDEFLAKNADESQVLSAYDKNILENAPKEAIEAHLKSIEKDIDYLEKGIDFYKKNPEQDYNGEMIKFNEKLLTPKLQMQKAYKQRLDELNLSENLAKSQGTAEIQKRSVQDYVDEFEQTFSSKIDEMNSHSFYNGGANVVKRFKANIETIKEMNLPLNAEQSVINKLFKLYAKQMNSWYPSMMSVGGANYNVKKGEKSFEIWGKTSAEISDLMESLKDTNKKIVQNESDIYSDEFVKIAPFALATGAQRIGISFNTKPSAKMIFTLKKKGAIWNSLEQVWSFKPERFEQAKEWLENSFYELATGEKKILNLSKEIQEVKPRIESFKDEQKRLAKEYKEQQATKKAKIDDLQTQERIAKRKLADIKDSVKTTQEAIKRHESADSTSWMLPELKKQLELHKKDAQSAQQTLENIQQKIKELNSLDLSYAPKRNADEITTKIQEKFKFDEKKAKDLYEWHKDSSPLTKNDDGTPKVFYHGSPNEFEVFDIEKTRGELGHYFTDDKSYAEQYMRDNGKIYAVFLKSKNIISLFDPKAAQKYKKFIFGDDLPELEKILKEKYKSLKASEYDLDNYKSAFYDLMRERNDKNVLRVPSIIGERLKTAGVDGVVSYKGAIVVFDSNQIKSIDNTGSWTDSAGKITKEKPSDESARHSYFNPQSPNILHSNEIWGGGLAGGTLNGLETDEDGNIIGFNPAKFVAGFIAGAAGTKAVKLMLNSKAGQNHALKVATNISDDFKALRENNLPLFAKIMQKIEPQTLLKSSKEAKNLSNEIFNKELQNAIKTAIDKGGIENLSELKKQVHFSKVSEFKAYFDEVKGNQGVIKTPYKDIKVNVFYAFNHFTDNTYKTNRDNIKSAFFSTFKKPLFVVEFTPQGKTKPSTYFYKPFYDENKKLLNLVGISIDEKGLLKFSTFYLDERGNRLKEFLKRTDLTIRYVEPSE